MRPPFSHYLKDNFTNSLLFMGETTGLSVQRDIDELAERHRRFYRHTKEYAKNRTNQEDPDLI